MAEHSATPWELCHHLQSAEKDASCKCGYRGGIWGDRGEILVCEMRNCDQHEGHDMTPVGDRATQLANAAFIVKAVNNHDALVNAVQRCIVDLEAARLLAQHTLGEPHGINQTLEIARSALARVSPISQGLQPEADQ